ncbi:MAG: hypothetical protein QME75_09690 [Deltaproteobacteria bacterium]|nr:hypothetical protein [Deltaproteobacteria bacterium]
MSMLKRKQFFFVPAAAMVALIILGPGTGRAEDDKSFTGEVVQLAEQAIAPGEAELTVSIEVPAGYEIMRDVPSLVTVTPADKSVIGLGEGADAACKQPQFPLRLPVKAQAGATRVRVDLLLYYCKQGAGGLCITKQARHVLPVKVDEAAKNKQLQVSFKLPAI